MTKTINKKVLSILMVFILSLSFSFIFTVANASASEIIDLDVLSDYEIVDDTAQPLAITNSLKGMSMLIIPAKYDSSNGTYIRVMNEELWSVAGSGYTPWNGHVDSDIIQWMRENGLDLFYVELVYNISGGASSYRVDFSVDNPEWVNYNTRVSGGNYVVQYMVPMGYHTYDLNVTPSGSLNALYLGGHISIG